MNEKRRYRSLFWPMVLIGVGVVWLLGNIGVIRPASLGVLVSFWPLILIFIGLDILFGRRSPVCRDFDLWAIAESAYNSQRNFEHKGYQRTGWRSHRGKYQPRFFVSTGELAHGEQLRQPDGSPH